jgi:hypothetical protein
MPSERCPSAGRASPSTNATGKPSASAVATTHTVARRRRRVLTCSWSQSIQWPRLRFSGAGSSRLLARTPGTPRTSPASRSTVISPWGETIGARMSRRAMSRQRASRAADWRSGGSWAIEASSAALIAPTLVPQ